MTAIISLESVGKSYGRIRAVDNVSIAIEQGEIFGLLGQNGSGKSTLLKIMATLLPQDAGVLRLFGEASVEALKASRRRIGVVFDHTAHWEHLTGYENAWFFARAYGLPPNEAKNRLEGLFSVLSLWERRDDPVETYSYGMRRKLGLIEALAHQPDLLLLDEPSIGLDYETRIHLYELLKEESQRGATVVFASNDIHETSALAGRVALLEGGRLLVTGEPDALVLSLDTYTRVLLTLATPIPLAPLSRIQGVAAVDLDESSADGCRIRLLVHADAVRSTATSSLANVIMGVAAQGGRITGIEVKEPDLGDVFLTYKEQ
jgi:ABC-2 type transport system ATP-binding protein